jgi:AraC-like DNA-binding protein
VADDRNALVPLRFDSSVLAESEQFATFASAVANFDISRPDTGPFQARALVWRVGELVIAQMTMDAVEWERSAARIRGDRTDHIYVNVHYHGRFAATSAHGVRRGGPGALLAVDMRQPIRIEDGRIEKIYVAMPRKAVLGRLEDHDPHALVASGGLTTLLAATLRTICATLPRMTAEQAPSIERMIVDLVVDALREALSASEPRSAREETLASRVRAFVDGHLADRLDVTSLCRELGVSRSSLYRAFGAEGGVLRHVQRRRLRRIRALLLDPAETRPISALALATGFADRSHLTRAFKQQFGMTPGAFRRASAAAPKSRTAASDENMAGRFSAWVRELN